MNTPSKLPVAQETLIGGIDSLELRAGEKKSQRKIVFDLCRDAQEKENTLRESLEELERTIESFDGGTCPCCNQPAKEMLQSL